MTNEPKAYTAEELAEPAHFKIRALAKSLVLSEGYFVFPDTTVTVCLLTTHHGHYEIGSSYFPDAGRFTPELGRLGARVDALNKLQPIADYLFREKQFNDGAVLEPVAVSVPQEHIALGVRYIDTPTKPVTPPNAAELNREATAIALAEMADAMKEVTEADIAEVISRMSIAARAEREVKAKAEIADTAAGLLHGGLLTPEEHDKITGPDYAGSAPVHKGELIGSATFAGEARAQDSQVSGDGVEQGSGGVE